MSKDELITLYRKYARIYGAEEQILLYLEDFLKKKEVYYKDNCAENRIEYRFAYERIYTSTKQFWVTEIISEQKFRELIDILTE